jgi:hypothetical protein
VRSPHRCSRVPARCSVTPTSASCCWGADRESHGRVRRRLRSAMCLRRSACKTPTIFPRPKHVVRTRSEELRLRGFPLRNGAS